MQSAANAPAPVTREAIVAALTRALVPAPGVVAAFLGGSDATGRTDRFSDIDLVVVVEPDAVQATFDACHAALEELSPIAHQWRIPEPSWHGHAQEFLSLRDADPAHFIDLLVQTPSGGERFLEPERHGDPVVLFDRAGVLAAQPLDRDALAARIDGRVAVLRQRFPLFQTLVTRAVARGYVVEAATAYQDYTLRPLIELLRIRHCPERFDYGARYLDRDLPEALRVELESLALPRSPAEVEAFRARADALFTATLAELDRAHGPR